MTATDIQPPTGVELIADERERQINELGYTAAHDAAHDEEDLAFAAACYAAPVPIYLMRIEEGEDPDRSAGSVKWVEPWPLEWEREHRTYPVSKEARLRQLTKAGALIAAEMDKLLTQDPGEEE